jgi:hypothetical protein
MTSRYRADPGEMHDALGLEFRNAPRDFGLICDLEPADSSGSTRRPDGIAMGFEGAAEVPSDKPVGTRYEYPHVNARLP